VAGRPAAEPYLQPLLPEARRLKRGFSAKLGAAGERGRGGGPRSRLLVPSGLFC